MTSPRLGAEALRQRLAGMPTPTPTSARERAAQLLRDALADATTVATAVPDLWPADPLADPWTALYVQVAALRVGGDTMKAISRQVERQVVRQQLRTGEHREGWPIAGEFGLAQGHFGTHAVITLMLTVYYRYCRLGLVGD